MLGHVGLRVPGVRRCGALLLGSALLVGCAARSPRVYGFVRPVPEPGGPVAVRDEDWAACDRKGDYEATVEYDGAKNKWVYFGAALGGVVGGVIAAAASGKSETEPEPLRVQREKTYEEQVRLCLKKRGYPLTAPEEPKRGFSP